LDEERLLANHSEAHLMMNAIDGARRRPATDRVGWWEHPETQVWAEQPEHLAFLHDLTVEVMRLRGYPSGADHQTPPIFLPFPFDLERFQSGLARIGYKASSGAWLSRDMADLYVKWDAEGRWDAEGFAMLGRRVSCAQLPIAERCSSCLVKNRRHRPTRARVQDDEQWKSDWAPWTHYKMLKTFHLRHVAELAEYDGRAVQRIARERRQRMLDVRQSMAYACRMESMDQIEITREQLDELQARAGAHYDRYAELASLFLASGDPRHDEESEINRLQWLSILEVVERLQELLGIQPEDHTDCEDPRCGPCNF
jgi:hypothetical protein